MKVIILAAGEGKRLRPLTNNQPKCMVNFKGKPLIDHILSVMMSCKIQNITIVGGYKKDILERHVREQNVKLYTNDRYKSTNMVYTLFCAENEMNDDIIVSYSDIVYTENVLKKLTHSESDFAVIVDKGWERLWKARMGNPLDDAETMKVALDENIIELGKKPNSYSEIQGQYIGLLKISKNIIGRIAKFYHGLDRKAIYDGKDYENMYMTSFIQLVIDNLVPVKAVFINGGWVEIDSLGDLAIYDNYEL